MRLLVIFAVVTVDGFTLPPGPHERCGAVNVLGLRSLKNLLRRQEPPVPAVELPAFEEEDVEMEDLDFLAEVDGLHAAKDYNTTYARLQGADAADTLWRLARVCVDLSDRTEKERYVREGLAAAELAVKLDPKNAYAQKWLGISLGLVGDFEPVKTKIKNSIRIKSALDIANHRLPEDPTVSLALGQWSLKLAGLGFFERKIAGALFGEPPPASYHDALFYFEKSHATKPSSRTASLIKLVKKKIKQ